MKRSIQTLFVISLLIGALTVAACGQRVPVEAPKDRMHDTLEY